MKRAFALLAFSQLLGVTLWAQLTLSTIRGTAVDPAGAVIPSAEIALLNLETNAKWAASTNANGDYEIPDLQRGTYRLTISAPGFTTIVADNIILEGAQIRRINATLALGTVGTEVTVKANAALISTDSSKLQSVANTVKYFDVPWVGAASNLDPFFITTQSMISQTNGAESTQWAGQSSTQVQEGQDGHTNDGSINQINDILDAQEVTIVTVNNTAEYARVGYMNIITKSGSNEFHGQTAYWNENSALGARQFFETKKTKTLIHTINASASGPVVRNKTFFYASVNILKIPSKQTYLQSVPTLQMRQGNFSQLLGLSKPTIIKDPLSGAPFPSNLIPASRINPLATNVNANYLPSPNLGGSNSLANNYQFVFPFPTDYSLRKDFTQRIDQQISSKNRLMARTVENWGLYVKPLSFPTFDYTKVRFNVHLVVEDTHIFSPALVNSLRVGFYKEKASEGQTLYGVTPLQGQTAVQELGLQGVNPQGLKAQGFPMMAISGYPSLYTNPGGVDGNHHDWGYADSLTWSRGRHVLKFGAEFKPQSNFNSNVPQGTYGSFTFNGSLTGYGYADFLLGLPYSSTRLNPLVGRTQLDSEFGAYVTDSLKVNPRLTLDLGLRWDRFGSAGYKDGRVYNWDPVTGDVIVPASATQSVSPLYPSTIKVVTGPVGPIPSERNFAPRFGAAYRLNDRTVIRGGFGIFTATNGYFDRAQGGGPYQLSETFFNTITSGQPVFSFPNPFPSGTGSVASQSVTGFPLHTVNGHIYQWNVTVERQVHNVGLRASYVGSHDYGLNYTLATDYPVPSLIPFSASRNPWPQFVNTTYYRNNGQSKFNALTLEAQRKAGPFTFDTHYTWASNHDTYVLDQYSPLFWGRDPYTPRQRLVFNAVWEVPVGIGRRFLNNAPKAVDGIIGGWQIYWIGYLETGHFLSPTYSGYDPTNTNNFSGPPDRICNGNLPSDQRSVTHWFDTSCFVQPPPGRWGNAGMNILEGPGYDMQNVSVAKTFRLTERFKFTFTAAISNAFNHPNFSLPSANISATNVGTISSVVGGGESRHIELRGRLNF